MHITYSEKLISYMKKKNYSCIAVSSISPKGCCADTTELLTSFVSDKAAQIYKEKSCKTLDGPYGEIFILTPGLEYDEQIFFDIRSFLGLKDIVVKGIAPWKL